MILDIKNAEKFFNMTGEDIKEAYKCVYENAEDINSVSGTKNIFLYIPGAQDDMYVSYLN